MTTRHSGWIAGGILLLACVWLLSGAFGSAEEQPASSASNAETEAPLLRVRVVDSQAASRTREARVSARTAPLRAVDLRAESAGRITTIAVERGQRVQQGDVLFELDTGDRAARVTRAQALVEERELQYKAAQRLAGRNLQSPVDVAAAKSNLKLAEAELLQAQEALRHTRIRAPFDGMLDTREVEQGDYLSIGDAMGRFIQIEPFLVQAQVSEDVVVFLKSGQAARTRLPDGSEADGVLRHVAREADASTRMFVVEMLVEGHDKPVIAGGSAVLMLPLEQVRVHVVEPASLALDNDEHFGIKSVDDKGRVQFHRATIEQAGKDEIWLGDLPDHLRIITVGQGFVSAGEEVESVLVSDAS